MRIYKSESGDGLTLVKKMLHFYIISFDFIV
jgi:hypothetical protein